MKKNKEKDTSPKINTKPYTPTNHTPIIYEDKITHSVEKENKARRKDKKINK